MLFRDVVVMDILAIPTHRRRQGQRVPDGDDEGTRVAAAGVAGLECHRVVAAFSWCGPCDDATGGVAYMMLILEVKKLKMKQKILSL